MRGSCWERAEDELVSSFRKFSTTNLSDALDKLGLKSGVIGILPAFDCPKLVGRAVTIKVTAYGMVKSRYHLGTEAIEAARPGDIIVIDNGGRKDVSCWGEVLSYAAQIKGVAGVVIDGAFRDLDAIREIRFPVYARGVVPVTARARITQESFNQLIQCGGAQVRPNDIIVADASGVVVIPVEKAEEVLSVASELLEKETAMIEELKRGIPLIEVEKKFQYEKMLKQP